MRRNIAILIITALWVFASDSTLPAQKKASPKPAAGKSTPRGERFIDNGDGTVTDTMSKLMWVKECSYVKTRGCLGWDKSKAYVDGLSTGGHDDWRMPTVAELKTLYSEEYSVPSFNQDGVVHYPPVFAPGGAYFYWSSWTDDMSDNARIFNFDRGFDQDIHRVLCFGAGVRAVRATGK